MNRRQKIVLSVTGIFLVALILMGLTYAYFLTQITGNTNPSSISVETANLELVYGDGNGILDVGEKLIPGKDIKFKDTNKNLVSEKTFTVTNNGDNTEYIVIVDNVSVTPEPFKTNDFEYTLTCKSYKKTDYESNGNSADETGKCDGVTSSTFPLTNNSILVGNNIDAGITHVYSLTMKYKETGLDQSDDMGKTFTARINIEDIKRLNPYSNNKNSLAYNILNNSIVGKNETELVATPPTKIGLEKTAVNYTNDVLLSSSANKETKGKQFVDGVGKGECGSFFPELLRRLPITITNTEYTWTYANEYSVDKDTELFSLVNPKTCLYSDENCINGMLDAGIDVYIAYYSETRNTSTDGSMIEIYQNLESIYKVENVVEEEGRASLTNPTPTLVTNMYTSRLYSIESSKEKIISSTQDDFGNSYYYRGGVEDNYVNFANMCWRIVRIDGNGNIKLILEDKDTTCDSTSYTGNWAISSSNYGYEISTESSSDKLYKMSYLNPVDEADTAMVNSLKDFQITLAKKLNTSLTDESSIVEINNELSKSLVSGNWCLNNKAYSDKLGTSLLDEITKNSNYSNKTSFYYDSLVRLGNESVSPTLRCNGQYINTFNDNTNMYVGTLTADEVIFAGGLVDNYNQNYYLINDYQLNNDLHWWTLSSSEFEDSDDCGYPGESVYVVDNDGVVYSQMLYYPRDVRPAINISGSKDISKGNGTKDNPYVIN